MAREMAIMKRMLEEAGFKHVSEVKTVAEVEGSKKKARRDSPWVLLMEKR
jgi:hypothetical protein